MGFHDNLRCNNPGAADIGPPPDRRRPRDGLFAATDVLHAAHVNAVASSNRQALLDHRL